MDNAPLTGGQVVVAFAGLSGGFWRETGHLRAWGWSFALAGAIILGVFANVTINRWSGWFFDALESRDVHAATIAIAVFPVLVALAAAIGVATLISRETLQVHWRRWLTTRLIDLWIANRRFHRLSQSGFEPANPEYRIADDVRWATEPVVDFAIGLLSAVITIITFIGILWQIGGAIDIEIGGSALRVPAYLVLAAIIYAIFVSCLILFFGQPLPGRVVERNEAEARLRFGLMRVRDRGEEIVRGHTEAHERVALMGIYDTLALRWLAMIARRGRLTWITNSNAVLVPVVPLLLAAPKYLSGDMSLGGVVQVAAAFVQVQIAFNWVVENFMRIAEWMASARRVIDLVEAIDRLESESGGEGHAAVPASLISQMAPPANQGE
jgi:vitamin B12/bleomycin/antimicrobial peptide transport system ATP-binding/permease protein